MARDLIFVKPLNGAKIRKMDTREYLKDEGEELERSSFWTRRQIAGEVSISKVIPAGAKEPEEVAEEEAVETAPPKAKTAAAKKKTQTKEGE